MCIRDRERDDYRENTINAGISACNGVFHRSKMEHPDFIKFNEPTGEPYVSVPLLAKYVREHLQYSLVRDNGKQGLLKDVYECGCCLLYTSFKSRFSVLRNFNLHSSITAVHTFPLVALSLIHI